MKHTRTIHTLQDHLDDGGRSCNICNGGLFICSVCDLAEGELTTDCPGVVVASSDMRQECYDGTLDFVRGHWIRKGPKL